MAPKFISVIVRFFIIDLHFIEKVKKGPVAIVKFLQHLKLNKLSVFRTRAGYRDSDSIARRLYKKWFEN